MTNDLILTTSCPPTSLELFLGFSAFHPLEESCESTYTRFCGSGRRKTPWDSFRKVGGHAVAQIRVYASRSPTSPRNPVADTFHAKCSWLRQQKMKTKRQQGTCPCARIVLYSAGVAVVWLSVVWSLQGSGNGWYLMCRSARWEACAPSCLLRTFSMDTPAWAMFRRGEKNKHEKEQAFMGIMFIRPQTGSWLWFPINILLLSACCIFPLHSLISIRHGLRVGVFPLLSARHYLQK